MKKGTLLIISGFSGAGKGTIVKELLRAYDDYVISISATTRKMRPGEAEGVSYFFLSKEEFEKRIENDEFLEYACYVDNYYGTPKDYVMTKLSEGKNVILEIECQGAYKIKKQFPEAVMFFITAPTVDEVVSRLRSRGTENEEQIQNRIQRASKEADYIKYYDYLIINDDLIGAVGDIDNIIKTQHYKVSNSQEKIEQIQKEFCAI